MADNPNAKGFRCFETFSVSSRIETEKVQIAVQMKCQIFQVSEFSMSKVKYDLVSWNVKYKNLCCLRDGALRHMPKARCRGVLQTGSCAQAAME